MLEQQFVLALSQPSFAIIGLAYLGGLASMFLPCTLSLMPALVGYIGGYADTRSKWVVLQQTFMFVLGLATVFTLFGTLAALLGLTFGNFSSQWWFALMGILTIVMALNLLDVIHIPLPSFITKLPEGGAEASGLRRWIAPFVLGLAFGAASSPCGTPFLAGILGLISNTQNVFLGASSLFTYALGQGTLLIIIGLFTGMLKHIATLRHIGSAITKLSGSVFLAAGLLLILEGFGLLAPLMTQLGLW